MKKVVILALAFVLTLAFAGLSFAAPKDHTFPTVGDEGAVTFSHAKHLPKVGNKCSACHPNIIPKMAPGGGIEKITMADLNAGKYCGACHNGTKAFDVKDKANCSKCHVKK